MLEVKFSMKPIKYMLAGLFALLMLSLISFAQEVPQAIVFENPNFTGSHTHFFTNIPDLTQSDNTWNDKISSIVVISGNWTFLEDPVGAGEGPNASITLGPGVYPDVTREAVQQRSTLEDDSISQVRLNLQSQ
jgi:hypothetical protein